MSCYSLVCDKPNRVFVAPVVDNGCRFSHHLRQQASKSSKTGVAVELNELRCYSIELNKTTRNRPRPTPSDGHPCVRLGRSIESMP
jgi:hypothetical protein